METYDAAMLRNHAEITVQQNASAIHRTVRYIILYMATWLVHCKHCDVSWRGTKAHVWR